MHIRSVPLTPENLDLCDALWADRTAYRPDERRRALDAAAALLAQGRALGTLVLEGARPRGFGLSTFVSEPFMQDYLTAPHPQLGKRLLLASTGGRNGAVLSRAEVAERNAGGGLELVIAGTAYDLDAANPDAVVGQIMAAFQEAHRGYRIARITIEVFGEAAINVVTVSASFQLRHMWQIPIGETRLRSLLGTLTRAQAAAWKTPLLPMFLYNPPRITFTQAQQTLLATALTGMTDAQLSRSLGMPLSTVKARWTRILQRVALLAPDLLDDVRANHGGHGRGAQARHILLQYVRENPSELTPYPLRQATRTSNCR